MAGDVGELEREIDAVERRLLLIKDEIAEWNDTATGLSLSAAEERARNAGAGRGLGGMLFGAGYRAAARRAAASSNAAIGREVVAKRQTIAHAKLALRQEERDLRWRLRDLKADLRDARSWARARDKERPRGAPPARPARPPDPSAPALPARSVKDELRRLKALHESGELDIAAYELARIELLQAHIRT